MNALDRSIHEHIPRLRRYARALVGDRTLADDLVQDTLERALTRFHLWRQGSDLRAWLFSIMHNIHIDQVRVRGKRSMELLDDHETDLSTRATQTDQLEIRDLGQSLKRLPGEQREILLLVALEQMTYEEVAVVLRIPVGTVMSRLSRGRERLRALLEGRPPATPLKVVK